ncbi:MAG TPA: DNA repair protein RecO [bacterium]|nr:DNA repair protein RecO [bacterium]
MAIQKTEAFVLKTQAFRSTSLMGTFFSKDFGKLKGVVKAVRREHEMRGAAFEPFTRLEILFYEKTRSDLHLISEASIVESHDMLRTRLDTICYASYFSELVDQLCEVHDPHPALFDLVDFAFRFLPSVPEERLSRLFEIHLLREIGWVPYLQGCLSCRDAAFEKGFFSVAKGAVYCPRCAPEVVDARPLSPEALAVLRYYATHSPELSLKLRVGERGESELSKLMDRFLTYRLNTPLKSRRFMDQMLTKSIAS